MRHSGSNFGKKLGILLILTGILMLLSITGGQYALSVGELLRILKGTLAGGPVSWTPAAEKVLLAIRLPRIAAAFLVGGALAMAGVSYQGMFRNPMVSPDILGASTGAGFGAALAILGGAGYAGIVTAAFAGGLAAVALAYGVSRFGRTRETTALILAGMIVSSLFSAGTAYIKLVADTQDELPAITYWLMGSLASIRPEDTAFLAVCFLLGAVPLMALRWRMNLLTLEEDAARSAGVNTVVCRLAVIVSATLLTASAVAVSGMIGWVGLVIPHFGRMLFGCDYRRLLPVTAVFGGAFLLLVDDIARMAASSEIPLGILTAFVGAPLFLYLLMRGGVDRD